MDHPTPPPPTPPVHPPPTPASASGFQHPARRDASALRLMAAFFILFGLLVLVGLLWDQTRTERIVSIAASTLLLLAGVAFLWIASRLGASSH
jgi:hypothetical protein